MQYTILDFATSLDLDHCKIQNPPDLLFLCGGPVAKTGSYRSARDFFHRGLKEKPALAERVRLAEEVNSCFKDAWLDRETPFSDLLEVENYIAYLSSATVLFVESPGSIAELGAFAASEDLQHKTLAILNDSHRPERSFIGDGPVRRLRNKNEDHVLHYKWNSDDLNSKATLKKLGEIASYLASFIEERDAGQAEKIKFRREQVRHVLLLVADLVWFLGVALRSDITDCLRVFDMERSNATVNRYLRILESVDLIKQDRHAKYTFYVSLQRQPFLRYAYLKDTRHRDRPKILTAVRQSFDSWRRSALATHLKETGTSA